MVAARQLEGHRRGEVAEFPSGRVLEDDGRTRLGRQAVERGEHLVQVRAELLLERQYHGSVSSAAW